MVDMQLFTKMFPSFFGHTVRLYLQTYTLMWNERRGESFLHLSQKPSFPCLLSTGAWNNTAPTNLNTHVHDCKRRNFCCITSLNWRAYLLLWLYLYLYTKPSKFLKQCFSAKGILSLGGYMAMSRNSFGCHEWGWWWSYWHLVSGGQVWC